MKKWETPEINVLGFQATKTEESSTYKPRLCLSCGEMYYFGKRQHFQECKAAKPVNPLPGDGEYGPSVLPSIS